MEQIHIQKNLETKSFTVPESVVTAKICTKSGKLAVEGVCVQYLGGDTTKVEYFAKGTVPTEKCDIHVKATICTESKALATENCPTVEEAVYLNKTETGVTADTPFLYPTNSCTIHKNAVPTEQPPTIPDDQSGNGHLH
jgi:penicillin-binding protein 1A